MSEDVDMEQLKEQTTVGNRVVEATKNSDLDEFKATLRNELGEIEAGERQKTVSVWDGDMAALVAALEEHPDVMERIGNNLRETLGRDATGAVDRSDVLKLVVRAGLQAADEEIVEMLLDAKAESARQL